MAGVPLLVLLLFSGSWAQSSGPHSECSLSEEHKADVTFLLDGFNHISADDFSAVRDFLRTVVPMVGPVAPDLVRVGLVKNGRDPETEFDLDSFHDLSSVVDAVSRMSQSPPLPGGNSDDALEFTLKNVFETNHGNRENVPNILVLVTDRNSSGVSTGLLKSLSPFMKVFVVGVKVELLSQSDYTYMHVQDTDRAEVFPVEDYQSISSISKELTQSLCRWLKEKLGREKAVRITDVQPRRARASLDWDDPQVQEFRLEVVRMTDFRDQQYIYVPGHKRSIEIYPLRPNTAYRIIFSAGKVTGGQHLLETVDLTTPPDSVRLKGGPSRCSGSVELMDRSLSAVCGTDFGLTEAAVVCGELDCGAVSEIHQGAPSTAVNRSFHCEGAETSLTECETSETNCSTAANVSCAGDVLLRFRYGLSCAGRLELRHMDEWRYVVTSVEPDLEFGSVLCEQMGCGYALSVKNTMVKKSAWSLEPECVKQRSGLSDCLDLDSDRSKTKHRMHLICSGAFPVLRASVSSEFLSVSWRQRLLLKLEENFTVSCSLDEASFPGELRLLSPTGNYTLPPANHSAHFLLQAFSPAHIGNYTCLYCLTDSSSEVCIKSTTLYISPGAELSLLLIRAAIFFLTFILWTSALWLYYKGCGRQKKAVRGARRWRPSAENNAVQMVVL